MTTETEIAEREAFSRQLASLREVAMIVGAGAISQDEMDMARDLVDLLKYLNRFDEGLQ